jgi:hypothetical protein
VHGIGCINTPVEEGAKEEGAGGIVVDIHGDNKVEMQVAGSQMKVWKPQMDVNSCPSVAPQMESGSVHLMKSICELG